MSFGYNYYYKKKSGIFKNLNLKYKFNLNYKLFIKRI